MPVLQLASTGTRGMLDPEFWWHPSHLTVGKIWKTDSVQQRNRPGLRPLTWVGWAGPEHGQNADFRPARHLPTYQDAMMALRASRTSAAARRCWGSRTSSFRMRHTVFSETRPSLRRQRERAQAVPGAAGSLQPATLLFPPLPRERDSLRDGVLRGLDLAEELLRDAVVEGELAVKHGEEHHAQGPHVARLAPVRPACGAHGHAHTQPRPGEGRGPGTPSAHQPRA